MPSSGHTYEVEGLLPLIVDVVRTTPPLFAMAFTDDVVALTTAELDVVLLPVVDALEVPGFGAVRTAKILPWLVRI